MVLTTGRQTLETPHPEWTEEEILGVAPAMTGDLRVILSGLLVLLTGILVLFLIVVWNSFQSQSREPATKKNI